MAIDTHTALYCVLGNPVSHSLSPVMHNRAFAHTGYSGVYLAFKVTDIAAAVTGIKALGIKGASITIPHKVAIMEFLDDIDEKATRIGAVNTIVNKDGRLYGYNTDWTGAMDALLEKTDIKDKDVVMIGAGGAARAIGSGIVSEGGKLTILNILEDEGELLAKDLEVNYYPLSYFNKVDCQILINATPVGMTPNTEDMPVNRQSLKEGMVVMDIVYNPLKTRLLKEAENIGCVTIDGVAMFVYQGAAQFEMWTGQKAPVDLMRQVVLKTLQNTT
ncbi:MAG: shikimate dehydrogenase [Deltaproteobacteria bacterium CG1_02_45_11]|nr:MAG: shikimate dehydrogenase [Deltaproteobacteria bacterium CG1_02_45_11]